MPKQNYILSVCVQFDTDVEVLTLAHKVAMVVRHHTRSEDPAVNVGHPGKLRFIVLSDGTVGTYAQKGKEKP